MWWILMMILMRNMRSLRRTISSLKLRTVYLHLIHYLIWVKITQTMSKYQEQQIINVKSLSSVTISSFIMTFNARNFKKKYHKKQVKMEASRLNVKSVNFWNWRASCQGITGLIWVKPMANCVSSHMKARICGLMRCVWCGRIWWLLITNTIVLNWRLYCQLLIMLDRKCVDFVTNKGHLWNVII